MTEHARKIFELLEHREGYTPAGEIAHMLGFRSDRKLRAINKTPGILEKAGEEIFLETGFVLLVRMRDPSGVKLSKDPAEIASARDQWAKWFWQIKRTKIDFYGECERSIRSGQLPMLFGHLPEKSGGL